MNVPQLQTEKILKPILISRLVTDRRKVTHLQPLELRCLLRIPGAQERLTSGYLSEHSLTSKSNEWKVETILWEIWPAFKKKVLNAVIDAVIGGNNYLFPLFCHRELLEAKHR